MKEQVPKKLDFDQIGDLLRKGDFLKLVVRLKTKGSNAKRHLIGWKTILKNGNLRKMLVGLPMALGELSCSEWRRIRILHTPVTKLS